MIIERMVFNLKFGKEAEAIQLWDDIGKLWEKSSKDAAQYGVFKDRKIKLLSGLSGRNSVLIIEMDLRSLGEVSPMAAYWSIHEDVQKVYRQFVACCENSERQMFKVEKIV